MQVIEALIPVNLTASGQICGEPTNLMGFYVNSTTDGTVVIRNGGASGDVMNGAITPIAGFHAFPASLCKGAYATITGTINITFFYRPI